MVGRVALVTAVAALLALPARAAAADRSHLPRGAHVLARSRIAVVYRLDIPLHGGGKSLKYLACVRSTGKKVVLDTVNEVGGYTGLDFDYSRLFTLNGCLVAFASESQDHYGGSGATVIVFDLRRRMQRYSVYAGGQTPGGQTSRPSFTTLSLALARTGMTAWVVRRVGIPEVGAASAQGAGPVLLDRGGGIDPASLKLLGGTVSWKKDGVPQYATPFP
jgi:hypothetical protein